MGKYLKTHQYYSDLYDRHTVDNCRRLEKVYSGRDKKLPNSEKLSEDENIRAAKVARELLLHTETGERYLNKEKTIEEWTSGDKRKDNLYETAQAPEDIRCLTCRNRLKSISKDLWSQSDKGDRVLFMYECPNKCLLRRAFFSDGEEWRMKPDLCPNCNTVLNDKSDDDGKKLVTIYTCPECKYTKTDEYTWAHKDEEIDENFAKDRDRFCLDEESGKKYQEEKFQLMQLVDIMKEFKEKEKARDEKLKLNPNGFHLEDSGYTCAICGHGTQDGNNWYDKWGIKCLVCQKAIDNGEIPASIAKFKDTWYTKYDIESKFNIKGQTISMWGRKGIIKARTVTNYGKGVHVELFLIEDNKDFLPPKKLIESVSITEMKNGERWTHSEPWYRYVDPHKHLKGYKIIDYLEAVKDKI